MNKIVCFLVDDDPDDREIFSIALKEINPAYECETANNCPEAMERIMNDVDFVPDFIFLDLNMPLLPGQQCLIEIKKVEKLKHVPIIIYSTSSNERDYKDTLNLGANHFLVKPSSMVTLVEKLKEIICEKNLPFLLAEE